jgi:hypothetical protein
VTIVLPVERLQIAEVVSSALRSKARVGHGGISGRIIINGTLTLKLRHDFILPIFAGVIQRVLCHSHNTHFSLPVKHFEIPFRASHAQKTDYAPVWFNGK